MSIVFFALISACSSLRMPTDIKTSLISTADATTDGHEDQSTEDSGNQSMVVVTAGVHIDKDSTKNSITVTFEDPSIVGDPQWYGLAISNKPITNSVKFDCQHGPSIVGLISDATRTKILEWNFSSVSDNDFQGWEPQDAFGQYLGLDGNHSFRANLAYSVACWEDSYGIRVNNELNMRHMIPENSYTHAGFKMSFSSTESGDYLTISKDGDTIKTWQGVQNDWYFATVFTQGIANPETAFSGHWKRGAQRSTCDETCALEDGGMVCDEKSIDKQSDLTGDDRGKFEEALAEAVPGGICNVYKDSVGWNGAPFIVYNQHSQSSCFPFAVPVNGKQQYRSVCDEIPIWGDNIIIHPICFCSTHPGSTLHKEYEKFGKKFAGTPKATVINIEMD